MTIQNKNIQHKLFDSFQNIKMILKSQNIRICSYSYYTNHLTVICFFDPDTVYMLAQMEALFPCRKKVLGVYGSRESFCMEIACMHWFSLGTPTSYHNPTTGMLSAFLKLPLVTSVYLMATSPWRTLLLVEALMEIGIGLCMDKHEQTKDV